MDDTMIGIAKEIRVARVTESDERHGLQTDSNRSKKTKTENEEIMHYV